MLIIIYSIFGSIPISGLIIVIILLNPDKIEIWSSLLWKLLDKFKGIFKFANKQFVKHDFQGRINHFISNISKDAPYFESKKVKLEWIDPEITRKAFIDKNEVILHLRRDDPEDHNFVHGAYLFVSTSLLYKSKRYISQSQREAIDLFVTTKIIEQEKPSIVGYYLDEYLHKTLDNPESTSAKFFEQFAKIDKRGLFYPILLQELEYLGDKVFGKRQDENIYGEINGLINYLENLAIKTIGKDTQLHYSRNYCHLAIVIVGKPRKITSDGDVYIHVIRKYLIPYKVETIYLLGRVENQSIMDIIADKFTKIYEITRKCKKDITLLYDDKEIVVEQYLVVMRLIGIPVFQSS